MIRGLAIGVLLIWASSAAADTLKLAHHYNANGAGPDGSKYSGTVTIDITSDTTFSIRWDIGGTIYNGFGMRRGTMLSAAFYNDKSSGLVMYEVQGDGLDGNWTFKGESGTGTEHLTPVD
jgi:hypothetical protein